METIGNVKYSVRICNPSWKAQWTCKYTPSSLSPRLFSWPVYRPGEKQKDSHKMEPRKIQSSTGLSYGQCPSRSSYTYVQAPISSARRGHPKKAWYPPLTKSSKPGSLQGGPHLLTPNHPLPKASTLNPIWEFPKIGVPYCGVLLIRILLLRVLY